MALSRKPKEIVEDSKNPLLAKHESWGRVPVGEIADILNGFAFKSSKFNNDKGMPLIRIRDVGKDSSETYYDGEFDETYLVNDGDLLVGMDGDFRTAIWKGGKALLNQRVCKISLKTDDYDFKFLSYALQPYLDAIHAETSAVTVKHLSSRSIGEIPLPLPPKEQQKRIVAKIEELFSHIDAGIEALKKAKQLLKQYRQSVLKAAVTGELTKEWREANKDKLEPASQLLERNLKERCQKWEEKQLEQFKAKGKMPKSDKWKEKYKELVLPDVSELTDIPIEWAWVNWEAILSNEDGAFKRGPFGSSLKKSIFVESGYKVYEQYCPINDDCSFARYYISEEKFKELKAFAVKAGDYLVSCSGVTLGRITQIPAGFEEGVINQALLRVRIDKSVMDEQYFKMFFRSPYFQNHIFDNVAGVAIPNVKGVKDLKAIPVPLPSISEQKVIYDKVNEKTSVIDRMEFEIGTQLKKAETNKQSILASAFSGGLSNKRMRQ